MCSLSISISMSKRSCCITEANSSVKLVHEYAEGPCSSEIQELFWYLFYGTTQITGSYSWAYNLFFVGKFLVFPMSFDRKIFWPGNFVFVSLQYVFFIEEFFAEYLNLSNWSIILLWPEKKNLWLNHVLFLVYTTICLILCYG